MFVLRYADNFLSVSVHTCPTLISLREIMKAYLILTNLTLSYILLLYMSNF